MGKVSKRKQPFHVGIKTKYSFGPLIRLKKQTKQGIDLSSLGIIETMQFQ